MDYKSPPPIVNYADPREAKAAQVREFLRRIGLLESSGGINTDHPEVTHGLNAGTNAVGTYGLMPATAQDLDKSSGVNQLQDMDKDEAQNKLEQDPELTDRLAATLASKLLNKNDQDTAAYKWLNGQYSQPSDEDLENSDRVRKFRVLKDK
jgi:hypothetical protein